MKVVKRLHKRRQRFFVRSFFLETMRRVPIDIKAMSYILKFVLMWWEIPSVQNHTESVHSLIRIAMSMKMEPMLMTSLSIIEVFFILQNLLFCSRDKEQIFPNCCVITIRLFLSCWK
jgi:hypothetical protein